nr:N-succinylarginine dihydrolase [Sphingomonas sp.]
ILVAPTECRDTPSVKAWLDRHLASNGPIRVVDYVDVRQSMANGGGPACLRLRVACDPSTVDPRFLVDEAKLDRLEKVIAAQWPEHIATRDLTKPALIDQIVAARDALLEALDISEL